MASPTASAPPSPADATGQIVAERVTTVRASASEGARFATGPPWRSWFGQTSRSIATNGATSCVKSCPGRTTVHLVVGQGGGYKGVKVGAEFKPPKGRGVLVKGVVGYSGPPNRRFDITPELNKAQKKLTVHAQPRPNRRAAAGTKLRR